LQEKTHVGGRRLKYQKPRAKEHRHGTSIDMPVGHHLRKHPFSPWDEAAADAVEAAINLPHVADILVPDANLNAPFTREELCSNLRRTATRRNMYPPSSRPTAETVTAEANAGSFSVVGDNILRICGLYNGVPVSP
jgi:hypothetical protein